MWGWLKRHVVFGARAKAASPRAAVYPCAILLAFCASCDVYSPALIEPMPRQDAGVTASFDVSSCSGGECWWSTLEPDRCKTAGMPRPSSRPPTTDDDNQTANGGAPIYLGFTQLRLGSTDREGNATEDAWQDFGFDLDGVCTNSSTCPNVSAQTCRAASPAVPFDGQLCRDNTFARLQPVVAAVPELGNRFGLSEDVFNCALWRGSYNMLVGLRGYNGQADDSQVQVDYYRSTGLEEPRPWKCPVQDFRNDYPRWRTSLKWRIDSGALTDAITTPGILPDSKFADPNAYVKDGYLVAQMPDGIEQGFTGDASPYRGFLFKAQKGLFVGRLTLMQDGTWAIRDGLTAGRIRKNDLVQAFREIGFCEDGDFASFYTSMLGYVNENADLLASGDNDPNSDCDAMSYALGFEAAQLTPGAEETLPSRIECCPPDKTDEECSATCGDGKQTGTETCDTVIPAGQAGACPTSCPSPAPCAPQVLQGDGCAVTCVTLPTPLVGIQDGCCPSGANATNDRDCPAVCGNGVLEGSETCELGQTCPTCVTTDPCRPMRAAGSAQSCDAHCEVSPITQCHNDDHCCPSGCSSSLDNDCLASCNNGVLDLGETCEAGTSMPCPSSCDDGIACTTDSLTGNVHNCNVACSHSPITQPSPDDGCCPPGATANSDPDCKARCGNGLIEPGEICDDGNEAAGDGCFNCQTESQAQICLVKLNSSSACATCTCSKCAAQALACQGAANAEDARLCSAMVDCGRRTGCGVPDCLCGSANLLSCIGPDVNAANGLCRNEVLAAGKTSSPADAVGIALSGDTSLPLGRANVLGDCARSKCATECATAAP